MTTRARSLAALALFASCAAALTTSSAGNLSFLADSPLKYFSSDDMDLMRANAVKALDAPGVNAKQSWMSQKNGVSGWAQVRSQFTTSDGTPCKRLRVVNKAQGIESDATYTLCKEPDRGWLLHTDATPAK